MAVTTTASSAVSITVTGIVQGVGFRPFVYRLATELQLTGRVGNDSSSVFIDVIGSTAQITAFIERVRTDAPPLAHVEEVVVSPLISLISTATNEFEIVGSRIAGDTRTPISPDSAVCDECVAELFDPCDRRFAHPFITCTNCGPRLSIITDLPYDRQNTTMASFAMCDACRSEYEDPTDRRYHAQPIGCPDCGPQLSFGARLDEVNSDQSVERAIAAIDDGGIVAVKGIGGYHLMCDATNVEAVVELRRRKHRPDKPFAIMVASTEQARLYGDLHQLEVTEFESNAAPIVLLRRAEHSTLPSIVAPASPLIGIGRAYAPIHHLLLQQLDRPLVATSANVSGAPLAFTPDGIAEVTPLYDAVLEHDRPIRVPVDDSVVRRVGDAIVPIRRARGYAPIPVPLTGIRAVLAVGGELKNTFCLAANGRAWVSQHIGDMENLETLTAFERMADEFMTMYEVVPDVVAIDAHPGYLSSKWARRTALAPIIEVQHHHAHVAAVMAEHQLDPDERVIGVAFDGTGYGEDGTIWGGEVLVASAASFDRVGHLLPVLLPGGDAAVRNPNRVALAQLAAADVPWSDDLAPLQQLSAGEQALLRQQLERSINCVPTTSMGRLFDAVASLLGVRHHVSYEAQAAIELEVLAETDAASPPTYRFDIDNDGTIDQRPVLRSIVDDLRAGKPTSDIAWAFHDAVAHAVEQSVRSIAARDKLNTVVLSGGVFQNALLLQLCSNRLAGDFDVRTHRLVPANDGGLSLGQAFVASHSINRTAVET